jgi:hypothetical protein
MLMEEALGTIAAKTMENLNFMGNGTVNLTTEYSSSSTHLGFDFESSFLPEGSGSSTESFLFF